MILTDIAPAKINLTLRIRARHREGWHVLESLVAFASLHDTLTLDPDRSPGLTVSGTRADAAGPAADNLVLKAPEALAARMPDLKSGYFHLEKRIPVQAGLGGGSADAAAALRLLARLNGLEAHDPRVLEAAAATGADVPVCLQGQAAIVRGRGEDVTPVAALPALSGFIVMPDAAVETAAAFAGLGLEPGAPGPGAGAAPIPNTFSDREDLLAFLSASGNDFEPTVMAAYPAIARTKAALEETGLFTLVRMSGSGAALVAILPENLSHPALSPLTCGGEVFPVTIGGM